MIERNVRCIIMSILILAGSENNIIRHDSLFVLVFSFFFFCERKIRERKKPIFYFAVENTTRARGTDTRGDNWEVKGSPPVHSKRQRNLQKKKIIIKKKKKKSHEKLKKQENGISKRMEHKIYSFLPIGS